MDPGMVFRFTTVVTLVTGTMFLMWLGEQITERGIGNGISLIIFAGIAAGLPRAIGGTLELVRTGAFSILLVLVLFAGAGGGHGAGGVRGERAAAYPRPLRETPGRT
jgi:preprotein translocase subunit SecY